MIGVTLQDLPPAAREPWTDLRDRLRSALGDDLVAMWAHGGTTSVADPPHAGDLDTYVILRRRPDDATIRQVELAHEATAGQHGIEWDNWYVLADDSRGSARPDHAWRERSRDTTWAIHRAHWLAGRFVTLHGPDPDALVAPPAWDELRGELDREIEHLERHVVEGDTDPYEATYALLTGSRILYALETRDVVISKRAAGSWALQHLAARWHPALDAAICTYDGDGSAADADLLASEMAAFVAFVREHLPPATDRPPGDPPRWSGY
jgi:Domain of unknown function (DUF4111)